MPHVAGHLIAAVGMLEAEAELTFEQGEPVAVSLDHSLEFYLATQHGRCCILNLQLLHLPTDYRLGKSAKAFVAFGIVLCSQCLPIDGEAKTDEPFIYCIPYKRLKIRAPMTGCVTPQVLSGTVNAGSASWPFFC